MQVLAAAGERGIPLMSITRIFGQGVMFQVPSNLFTHAVK